MQYRFTHLVWIVLCSLFATSSFAQCPINNETELDCPWAEVTRAIGNSQDSNQIRSIIESKIPGFIKQVEKDAQSKELLSLWSLSRNIDESALSKGTLTVPANILRFLNSILQVPYDDRYIVGHAGLTHTYGYLFSTLNTPFGYKRFRYVGGEIESGFGLERGLFSGQSTKGTLLSNLTTFVAPIAFRDSELSKQDLSALLASRSIEPVQQINYYPRSKLDITRVVERVENKEFIFEGRTDFVKFPKAPRGKNQVLLIYSIDYRKPTEPSRPRLVTVFPVEMRSLIQATQPNQLKDGVTIQLRYNAMLPVTLSPQKMVGRRFIAP